jgi:hypothetical protein
MVYLYILGVFLDTRPMKEFDPLIDPTIPFPPTRRISIGIGSSWGKSVVVSEAVYQILFRLMEETKKKAAADHAKKAILDCVARWHRMRDRDRS